MRKEKIMRIGIGADHGGFVLKEAVIKAIESLGHEYKDYGTYSEESCDYPDYALKVAAAVKAGKWTGAFCFAARA